MRRAIAAAVLLLGLVTAPSGASAEEPDPGRAPFPADRVAVIPDAGAVAPPLAMADLYVAPTLDREIADVVVRFAQPFTLPNGGYRVSVLVGEATGPRLAVSLLAPAGVGDGAAGAPLPAGRLFRYDGTTWNDLGPTDAQFDDLGFVLLSVPLHDAPPGPAVWVEIAEGTPPVVQRISPYFSREAVLGGIASGRLPGDTLAVRHDRRGQQDQHAVPVGEPPSLHLRRGSLIVEGGPGPAVIGDQPVTGVVDGVRLIDGSYRGGPAPELRIDRRAGSVTLVDDRPGSAGDRSGDGSWLRQGPLPGGGGPVEVDFAAVGRALGIGLDAATTGLAIRRILTLADGQVLVAEGVVGTLASLDRFAPIADLPALPPRPAPPPPDRTAGLRTQVGLDTVAWMVAAAMALAALGWLGSIAVRARRRRPAVDPLAAAIEAVPTAGGDIDRVPWAEDDGALTASAERELLARITSELPAVETPAGDEEPLVVPPSAPLSLDQATDGLALPDTGAPVLPGFSAPRRPGGFSAFSRPTEPASVPPADVLAALDAEVAELRDRIGPA
jgi:hypothetical protein